MTRAEFEVADPPDRRAHARSVPAGARRRRDSTRVDIDEVVLVGGSTRIPLRARAGRASFFGTTPHTELNPDEVVALGAAVQADILVTGNREMLLLDVTPLSLGIETMGGVTSKLILRNSTIPATGSEMFTTVVDNQTAVDIHVLQGERELVADNRSLARFKLRGIPPMPAGMPRVAGAVPDRRERHPERHRPRAAHRCRADDRGEAVLRPHRRRSRAYAARIVRARRGRFRGATPDRRAERGRDGDPGDGEDAAIAGVRRVARPSWSAGRTERIQSALAGLKTVLGVDRSRDDSEVDPTRSTTRRSTWPRS